MGSETIFIKLKEERFTLCFDLMNIRLDYKHHWLKLVSSVEDMLNKICSKADLRLGDVYLVHRRFNKYCSLDFNHISIFSESGSFDVNRPFLGFGYGEPVFSGSSFENDAAIYRQLKKVKSINYKG